MSEPNQAIARGLAGIRGLNFAYRLNTWGPKEGPAMIPANTFPKAMLPPPALAGLKSPFTWFEGVIGIEAPSDMVADAGNTLNDAEGQMAGTLTQIQTLIAQADGYNSSSDQTTLSKAQACEAEAAGLVSTYQALQTASAGLQNQITTSAQDPNVTKDTAQNLKNQASAFSDQVSTFLDGIKQLSKDVAALASAAQSGPGVTGYIENLVSTNVSTLTWIAGAGAMIYLLAPSFIPRLAHGLRKS